MAAPRRTPEQLDAALALVEMHGTVNAAAVASGIPEPTLRKRYQEAVRVRGASLVKERAAVGSEQRLRAQLKSEALRAATLERQLGDAETLLETVLDLTRADPRPPAILPPERGDRQRGALTALAMLTDLHWGETVKGRKAMGLRDYNPRVAKERMRLWLERTVRMIRGRLREEDRPLDALVLVLGGDLVSGQLHEELAATNALTDQQTVLELLDALGGAIGGLLEAFPEIDQLQVVGVPGNHGRLTRKPWAKAYAERNTDWLICRLLARECERAFPGRTSFYAPRSRDALVTIYGQRVLVTHGDALGVKGGDGQIGAAGPIIRGSQRVAAQYARQGQPLDWVLMGHWHQEMSLSASRVLVSPAFKGPCEYSTDVLRVPPGASPAAQLVLFFHPTRGLVFRDLILLEDSEPTRSRRAVELPREAA